MNRLLRWAWLTPDPMLRVTKPLLAGSAGRRSLRLGLSRRRFVQSCGLLGLSGFATAAYGVGIEPESLLVTRYRLMPPGWPAGQRLSINVVADLHAGGPNMTSVLAVRPRKEWLAGSSSRYASASTIRARSCVPSSSDRTRSRPRSSRATARDGRA